MALESSTLRQTVAKLLAPHGVRDYLRQLCLIHGNSLEDHDGEGSEESFIRRAIEGPDEGTIELDKLLRRTNPMIRNAVKLLALIAPLPEDGRPVKPGSLELFTFHESLFGMIYRVRTNLRRMFELAFDCEDDPEELIEELREKYGLADPEVEALTLDWVMTYESICQGLLDQSMILKIFSGSDSAFRLDDEEGNMAVDVPRPLLTGNGLIISRDYFFLQILFVLKHVQVMTKLLSLEKEQPYADDEIPVMEMFEMDAVFPIAEAFMDRE